MSTVTWQARRASRWASVEVASAVSAAPSRLPARGGDAEARRPDRGEPGRGERGAGRGVPGVGQQQRVAGAVQVLERGHRRAPPRRAPARGSRPGQARGPAPNGWSARSTSTRRRPCGRERALIAGTRDRRRPRSSPPSARTPGRAARRAATSRLGAARRAIRRASAVVGAGRVGSGAVRGGARSRDRSRDERPARSPASPAPRASTATGDVARQPAVALAPSRRRGSVGRVESASSASTSARRRAWVSPSAKRRRRWRAATPSCRTARRARLRERCTAGRAARSCAPR